jgi:RHS repeat-associated protein
MATTMATSRKITDNQAWPLTQTYTYDSLNRVATAQSLGTHSSAPGTCWAETYNYDAWGNLYSFGPNSTTQSAYIGCSQESGLSSSATNNNQLSTYTYDAAGNLIAIPAVANYTYDAENHLVSAGGLNYSYDGDGKRVMKSNGILYWYGAGSDPLFESDTSGYQIFKHFYFNGMRVARQEGWAQGYWIDHYVNDALGNARFVYGYNGAWDVSDYYPFGGEHPYQSQEGNVFKFTGKERDSESALDNFGARYYANAMGRFMSPDPIQHPSQSSWDEETFLATPQRWNEYGYVLNNPLNHTDPNGDEIPVWERRLEGGPPTDTRTALSEALLVGGAGAAASAGGAGVLARAAGYSRGLITAAIGYFLTPQGQQTAQDIAEAVAPPGSNLNVGRIAANLGISSIETLGESGVVGQLSSGASISAGFGRVGGSLAVNISNIASDVKGGVNFFQLQGNAVKAAQAEGLSSVTLTAQNVINSKLAQALVKQGFTKQVTQDARGNQIINYVKKIPVSN